MKKTKLIRLGRARTRTRGADGPRNEPIVGGHMMASA